ncbi:glutamate-gated chloride channel-like [Tropilaelaps mercedesae]|uniref:Glutamate-gated chloride channel-like n=1 Tax=Tropilaelaps mercedesae TaxID=418985 RepID=A0A1V9XVK0_9ACAR|nr:glutamate-gated chloride channel-like [Tropilaelaps mercedesae]
MDLARVSCFSFLVDFFFFGRAHDTYASYPIVVKVRLDLNEILFVDDHIERVAFRIGLLTEWDDLHLKHGLTIDEKISSKNEFDPELFLDEEEELTSWHRSTRAIKKGKIHNFRSIVSVFTCRMSFNWLPVDVQGCSVLLRSAIHDRHVLFLSWASDPINISANHSSENFTLSSINKSVDGNCIKSVDFTDFSCLVIEFLFQRNYRSHLTTYIVPTALLAVLSWLTLFCRCSPIRGIVLVVCTFATGCFIYSEYVHLACPSCLKFLDAWTLTSGGIVLFCLFEFIVVQFTFKRQVSGRKLYTSNDIKPNSVDSVFQVAIGAFLSFVIVLYLTFIYIQLIKRAVSSESGVESSLHIQKP